MKYSILLLTVPTFLVGVGWLLRAEDAPPPRDAGKVLILKSERILEGDVERAGDQYRVRRGTGEVAIPVSQALRLCADRAEAYRYMQSRANLADPDERLRLARWCYLNQLGEQAHVEAKCALEMRPNHAATKQLVKLTEHGLASRPSAVVQVKAEESAPPLPSIDLSFESVTTFRTHVQPILMNTCISCHSGVRGGRFQLYRVHEGGLRVATQRNLAAVLAQVNLDRPTASPLLVMAVSAHGNISQSPLPDRKAPTFQTLLAWIEQTIADNPHLRERTSAVQAAAVQPARQPPAIVSRPVPRVESKETTPPQPLPASVQQEAAPEKAPAVKTPADEFDPLLFNQLTPKK